MTNPSNPIVGRGSTGAPPPKASAQDITCAQCGLSSFGASRCPRCGEALSADQPASVDAQRIQQWHREKEKQSQRFSAGDVRDRFGYGGLQFNLWALPTTAAITLLLAALVLPTILFDWFSVFCHELGHSLIFWLSGRAATPLALGPGIGWASGELNRSWWVFTCFTFLIGVIGWKGIQHKSPGLVILSAVLLVAEMIFNFAIPEDTWDAIMVFFGVGGELILGTLVVISFYYQLPDKMRWDFFRFPLLSLGLYTFGKAALLWHHVKLGDAKIPYGTFMRAGDSGGDMNRLVYGHGWGEDVLVGTYISTAVICGLVIVAHYIVFAVRAHRREQRERLEAQAEEQAKALKAVGAGGGR